MPDRKLTSWIALAIALAFVAVAVFGIVTYHNTVAVRQGEALVAHSYAVRETTRELLSSVKDMETGQRGFLITGVPAYLEPYHAGLDEVEEEFARLRKLTQDNPAQQRPPGQIAAACRRQTGGACGSDQAAERRRGTGGFRRGSRDRHGRARKRADGRNAQGCWRNAGGRTKAARRDGKQRQSRERPLPSISSSPAT